jgi:hypothetical protein
MDDKQVKSPKRVFDEIRPAGAPMLTEVGKTSHLALAETGDER